MGTAQGQLQTAKDKFSSAYKGEDKYGIGQDIDSVIAKLDSGMMEFQISASQGSEEISKIEGELKKEKANLDKVNDALKDCENKIKNLTRRIDGLKRSSQS